MPFFNKRKPVTKVASPTLPPSAHNAAPPPIVIAGFGNPISARSNGLRASSPGRPSSPVRSPSYKPQPPAGEPPQLPKSVPVYRANGSFGGFGSNGGSARQGSQFPRQQSNISNRLSRQGSQFDDGLVDINGNDDAPADATNSPLARRLGHQNSFSQKIRVEMEAGSPTNEESVKKPKKEKKSKKEKKEKKKKHVRFQLVIKVFVRANDNLKISYFES